MTYSIEIEQEDDGRWLAEVIELPGFMANGATSAGTMAKVRALALRVSAERLERGEVLPRPWFDRLTMSGIWRGDRCDIQSEPVNNHTAGR